MSTANTEFDALLEDLTTLQKAVKSPEPKQDDEAKILAAAKDEDDQDDQDDNEDDDDDDDAPDRAGDADDDDARPISKAFAVTLSDGSSVAALDGTDALLALSTDLAGLRAQADARNAATHQVLSNAVTLLKSMSADLESLRRDQQRMVKQSRGRQSVLHAPAAPAAATDAPDRDALLAKAIQRLGPVEVAEVNSYLNMGEPVPAHLMKALTA